MSKLLFVHDHQFYQKNDSYYSDKLPYRIFGRYLEHFESITIFSRQAIEIDCVEVIPKSSGQGLDFLSAPNLSNLKNLLLLYNQQYVRLKEIMEEHDALVARLPSEYGLMAIKVAKELNIPYVVEVVGCAWDALWNYGSYKAKSYAPILTLRMKKAVLKAEYVSYVSQSFLQGRYPANIRANTVSVSNVELPEVDKNALSIRLDNISKDKQKIVFGTIGSMKTKYKGIHNAITVLAKLKVVHPELQFEFRILGDGDLEFYRELANKLDIKNNVIFDGSLPSGEPVFNWLDNIDIYLHPSYQEGVPRALIEAMSRACPALASTTGGIPELIDKSLLFKAGDEGRFYTLISNMIRNKALMKTEAMNNFNKAKNYEKQLLDERRKNFFQLFSSQIVTSTRS